MIFQAIALMVFMSLSLNGQSIGVERGFEVIKTARRHLVLPKDAPDGIYEVRVYAKDQELLLEYSYEAGKSFLYRFENPEKFTAISSQIRRTKNRLEIFIGKERYMFLLAVAEGKVS